MGIVSRIDVCRTCNRFDGETCTNDTPEQWVRRLTGKSPACGRWIAPSGRAVILPHLGEFGWLIMTHIRWINWCVAEEKIVCARRGDECLYPSATAFEYEWENPIPDVARCTSGSYYNRSARETYHTWLAGRLAEKYPGYDIVDPTPHYDCRWHMSDGKGFKFAPKSAHHLGPVDVVVGPRKRGFEECRNWHHWDTVCDQLREAGRTVGIVGLQGSSANCQADAYCWDHPDGPTAGAVDLLANCRVYCSIDSGNAHLAAMLDRRTVLIHNPSPHNELGVLRRANRATVDALGKETWDRPELVTDAILRAMDET